ncbi:MAG: SH3 domain-containing protein, partial [Clostridia bacterium]|nr:SH3 domain-containing protein [Clostridia bacterium]
ASGEGQTASGIGSAVVSLADDSQILNLRASPTTAAGVLSYLRSGQVLTVLERYSKWTQVQYGSVIGYVMNDYIRSPEEPAESSETEASAITVTSPDQVAIVLPSTGLNLRLSASVRSASIMVLPQGTILSLKGNALDGMLPVMIGSISGYVAQEYVYVTELSSPEPTAVPTPEPTLESFRLYARVNAENGLILRTGPAQQADAVRLLPNGTEILITGEAESGFFPVIAGSDQGYVSEKYLTFLSGDPAADPLAGLPTETPGIPALTPSPVPPASRVLSGERAYVNAAGGLNLRSEPSAGSAIQSVVADHTQVVVLGSQENGFYPVRIGTMTGYLSADYLVFGEAPKADAVQTETAPAEPASEQTETGSVRMIVQSENGLNLRAAPNTGSEVLYILPYGTVLTVIDSAGGEFIHVRWNNYEGYVSSAYVSPIGAR